MIADKKLGQYIERFRKAFEISLAKVVEQKYSHDELVNELAKALALQELDRELIQSVIDDKSEIEFLDRTVKPLIETSKMFLSVIDLQHSQLEAFAAKPKLIASEGGKAKANKYKLLEEETIRLYKSGKWKSVPQAALDITPRIVEMSKRGNGDLLPSTTKPLEWIRAYKKREKSNPS